MSGLVGSSGTPSRIVGKPFDNQVWCRMAMYNSGNHQGFTSNTLAKVGLDTAKQSIGLVMADTSNQQMQVPAGHGGWWLLSFNVSYYTSSNNISDHYAKISVERSGSAVENVGTYHTIDQINAGGAGTLRHASGTSTALTNLQAGDILKLYGRSDGTNPVFFYGDNSGTEQCYMLAVKVNNSSYSG